MPYLTRRTPTRTREPSLGLKEISPPPPLNPGKNGVGRMLLSSHSFKRKNENTTPNKHKKEGAQKPY